MHIVIPMSGAGTRFLQAGYTDPKPLIMIDGLPIIEHVCNLFPGETKFTFICRDEHLQTTPMREILMRIRPTAEIVSVKPHRLGPVWAVTQIFDRIDDEEEIIVNYCDFGAYWDYADFLHHTRARQADGAIPAYKNFHPHMMGSTNYAFMRDKQQWMEAIQEKKPFTNNRLEEYASSGTYYFKHGRYVKKYFQKLIDLQQDLHGEYYVSMVYNLMRQDNLKISIYAIQHMLQWGTPEDVADYLMWSAYFKKLTVMNDYHLSMPEGHVNLIPLAGHGSRFKNEGYLLPKPLLPVSGKPMVIQAAHVLPLATEHRYVCLEEHLQQYPLEKAIHEHCQHAEIIALNNVTEGQAISCDFGLANIADEASLFIAACDNSMLFDIEKFKQMVEATEIDAIVFTFKNHPSVKRNPQMYGYVKVDEEDNVVDVSVKLPISDNPMQDHAIVGAFYFKNTAIYREGLASLITNKIRVNNEFYIDSVVGEIVRLGYCVKPLLVSDYICWGTPNDLRTFEYWQSFFHKADWHPYCLEKDATVASGQIEELIQKFANFF